MESVYGSAQDFLGIKLTHRDDNRVEMVMKSCLSKACDEFGEKLTSAASPTKNGLFEIDENSPPD